MEGQIVISALAVNSIPETMLRINWDAIEASGLTQFGYFFRMIFCSLAMDITQASINTMEIQIIW